MNAADYEDQGYALVSDLISPDQVERLSKHAASLRDQGLFNPDGQVPGSIVRYGDEQFDRLLIDIAEHQSENLGIELGPTYSFARYYFAGQELFPHRDRPECEHSVTITLAGEPDSDWPISLRGNSTVASISIPPGSGVFYRGDRLLHWRKPLASGWHLQLFCHFVDMKGQFADRLWDGRSRPGAPSGTRSL